MASFGNILTFGKNMKIINIKIWAIIAVLAALVPCNTQALNLTLGGAPNQRTASLSSATQGASGIGNATVTTVNSYLNVLSPWTERGSVEPASGSRIFTVGMLTVNVTSGAFGSHTASGTWTINNTAFWTTYANAAISLHVGNGGGDPDHFVWLLEQGQSTGTWSYAKLSGGGGGLSNLKLYSSGTATVADGGSAILLLGAALSSLGLIRRKLAV